MERHLRPPVWETRHLYDLFILGLSWMTGDTVGSATRPALGIFRAYQHCGFLSDEQRSGIATNWDLVKLFMEFADTTPRNKPHSLDVIAAILTKTPGHVKTFVPEGFHLNHAKFFGREGYQHAITPLGREYAESITPYYVAPAFEGMLTRKRFDDGWELYASSIRGMHANRGDRWC